MENVTVYYFPVKAMGESIRMLLAYGGQEFEDKRIGKDDWPAYKESMPFGQMPVLEINGKKYAQTVAIARLLGRKYGLVGDDIEQDFEIDQNVDFFTDIRLKAAGVFHETDEKIKNRMHDELLNNYYPKALKKLDEIVAQNDGHIALGKLSWGDFVIAGMYDCFKMILKMPDLDEKYPNIKRIKNTVLSIPKVKEFCDAAPKCDW
ncbi:glutathione S-transferase 2-like isoform X2 [Leptidea sinapis]|nr:glutathione S-transferase 2-like isoform X2 [Leptidea sinapis]